jgi:hypothetical protein
MACPCCSACFECCDINAVTIYDPFGNPYTLTYLGTIDLSDFVCLSNLSGECAWQLTETDAHGPLFGGNPDGCGVNGKYNLIFWCQDIGGTITPRFAWERYILDPGDGVTKVCCESDSCTVTCTVVDNVAVWSLNCNTDEGPWTADIA